MTSEDPALKTLKIFEVLAEAGEQGLGLTDVYTRSGLSRSSAHRLLGALTEAGYTVRRPDAKTYTLGLSIVRLASSMLKNISVRQLLHPLLEELSSLTGETAQLAQLERHAIVFIDKVDSPKEIMLLSTYVGKQMPLHSTAAGKAILAHLPQDVRRRVYEETGLQRVTARTLTDIDALEAELAEIRERGYSLNEAEQSDSIAAIGAPIINGQGEVIAAISVAGPMYRFQPRDPQTIRHTLDMASRMNGQIDGVWRA